MAARHTVRAAWTMLRVDSVREVAHIIITVMGSGAHKCSRRFAFMSPALSNGTYRCYPQCYCNADNAGYRPGLKLG